MGGRGLCSVEFELAKVSLVEDTTEREVSSGSGGTGGAKLSTKDGLERGDPVTEASVR
jgi:hypothetical protein